MSRILEAVLDAFFGVFTFFSNLSVSRYDDPVLAEYKRRKIACVASTAIFVMVTVVLVIVGSMLDSAQQNSMLTAVVDGLRAPVGYAFMAALGASTIWMAYAYFTLWRFLKDGGSYRE